MAIRINDHRVEAVGKALARLGLEAIYAIEEGDPQYRALEFLIEKLRDCSSASLLVVLNALVSYQLSMPGEYLSYGVCPLLNTVATHNSYVYPIAGHRVSRSSGPYSFNHEVYSILDRLFIVLCFSRY